VWLRNVGSTTALINKIQVFINRSLRKAADQDAAEVLLERSVCTRIGHIEETKRQHHKNSSTVESSRTTEDRQTKEQLEKRSRAREADTQQNHITSRTVQPTYSWPICKQQLDSLSLHFNGHFPGEPGLAGVD